MFSTQYGESKDLANGESKDLARRTQSDKFWEIKCLKLQVIQNFMDVKED